MSEWLVMLQLHIQVSQRKASGFVCVHVLYIYSLVALWNFSHT